jgi:uncharacterized protein (DUF488 family)
MFTIGHSTRSIEEFIELLEKYNIELLVDIRSYPGSRRYPQFNKEQMQTWVPAHGVKYTHLEKLGGRRVKQPVDQSLIDGWTHPSFRNYAGYMLTEDFENGLEKLIELSKQYKLAFMCSEAVWWKCHRRMVSDALVARGFDIEHIMGGLSKHELTSFASIENGVLTYPGKQVSLLTALAA